MKENVWGPWERVSLSLLLPTLPSTWGSTARVRFVKPCPHPILSFLFWHHLGTILFRDHLGNLWKPLGDSTLHKCSVKSSLLVPAGSNLDPLETTLFVNPSRVVLSSSLGDVTYQTSPPTQISSTSSYRQLRSAIDFLYSFSILGTLGIMVYLRYMGYILDIIYIGYILDT